MNLSYPQEHVQNMIIDFERPPSHCSVQIGRVLNLTFALPWFCPATQQDGPAAAKWPPFTKPNKLRVDSIQWCKY